MLSELSTPEFIENCRQVLISSIGTGINLFKPYIIAGLVSSSLFFIIKKVANYFYLISGYTSREAKKKSKQLCDGINVVSNLYDVYKK